MNAFTRICLIYFRVSQYLLEYIEVKIFFFKELCATSLKLKLSMGPPAVGLLPQLNWAR